MKLLTAAQIKLWDEYTIKNQPTTGLDLMEHAAGICASRIEKLIKNNLQAYHEALVFCGTGNNGGDGLVIARNLQRAGINVRLYVVETSVRYSHEFNVELSKIRNNTNLVIHQINSIDDLPIITPHSMVVDAILGIGINKPAQGLVAQIIQHINKSHAYIVAIDIPSGLPAQVQDPDFINHPIIKASVTYTFQLPKLAFMHAESFEYTSTVEIIDIGLLQGFLNEVDCNSFYVNASFVKGMLRPRETFTHEGSFGHLLTVAGSYGKIGAAMLSAKAGLRTGCGLVTAYVPSCGYVPFQSNFPEAMLITDLHAEHITALPNVGSFDAVAVGPGLGTNEHTKHCLVNWLQEMNKPVVIDADGLNLIAAYMQQGNDFQFPESAIITPHPKEFDRLSGNSVNSFERLNKIIEFAAKHRVYIVLKGAYTRIVTPESSVFYNGTGNPLLATAGSGDVLTGIISSLLAQQYLPLQACIMGVYLHGLIADELYNKGMRTITASDIINEIPYVLSQLH